MFHEVLILSTALTWLYFFFSSWLFTVAIRSYKIIVNAEKYGRAGVSEFNDFDVAVSFDVVVAELGVVEGDGDLF